MYIIHHMSCNNSYVKNMCILIICSTIELAYMKDCYLFSFVGDKKTTIDVLSNLQAMQ